MKEIQLFHTLLAWTVKREIIGSLVVGSLKQKIKRDLIIDIRVYRIESCWIWREKPHSKPGYEWETGK